MYISYLRKAITEAVREAGTGAVITIFISPKLAKLLIENPSKKTGAFQFKIYLSEREKQRVRESECGSDRLLCDEEEGTDKANTLNTLENFGTQFVKLVGIAQIVKKSVTEFILARLQVVAI